MSRGSDRSSRSIAEGNNSKREVALFGHTAVQPDISAQREHARNTAGMSAL
jgi:hypothetical protein